MSPDPPREDSGEDENRLRRFSGEFMEGMMNDDEFFIIAPDAPYEMDMDDESEYSDSDDDGANGGREASTSQGSSRGETRSIPQQRVELVGGPEGDVLLEGQSRGRYRLLIPFPASTIIEDNQSESGTSGTSSNVQSTASDNQAHGSGSSDNTPQIEVHDSSSDHSQRATDANAVTTCDETSSTSESDSSKREIDLTEEKVEKIKEVMKNITLPPASIPKWVSEVDEDGWKKKLSDSITSKVSKSDKR